MLKKYFAWVRSLSLSGAESTTAHSTPPIEACWLEDRLLYSATALPIEMMEGDFNGSGFEVSQAEVDAIMDCINEQLAGVDRAATDAVVALDSTATAARLEVAFVDSSLDNLADLLDQLQATYNRDDTTLEVVLIDRQTSGVEQITNFFAANDHEYSSIHLVTHGSSGQFQLGSDWINVETLGDHSQQIAMWQSSLTDDADLLVYACQVASTSDGQQLGNELAELLNIDVAMSSDVTGNRDLGGDWELEYRVGSVETLDHVTLESLDRWYGELATYTVTNTNDSGAGSLRQAILDANANAGADTINFSIAATGVNTINLSTLLPTISEQVTINAATESDFAGTPLVVLNGGGSLSDGFLLGSTSSGSTIRGFVIQGFTNGISASDSSNHVIAGNYIGTSSTGNAAAASTVTNGINFWNTTNTTIGGTTALDRNVIAAATNIGIVFSGASTGNQVRGNYIGIGANGTSDLGNRWYGIFSSAANNTIGGNVSGAGNVISGTGTSGGGAVGVYLTSAASGTTIQGNIIGLNAAGTAAVANDGHGMNIQSSNNIIGGTSALERNVISGNNNSGIWLAGSSNAVRGNYFGLGTDGSTSIGNAWDGLSVSGSNNVIGGSGASDGNIIANNGDDGVEIVSSGTGNAILRNSIYNNSSMAIDLGGNNSSPTMNDFNDSDTGTNGLQNFPVLKTATTTNGNTTITGKLNSAANTTYRIEFYSNPFGTAESTGYGEARTYLGSTTVTTDGSGNGVINATLNGVSLTTGSTVTATATVDLSNGNFGSTSEFGGNIVANKANLLISGSYTGDGTDDRSISSLGFRAEVIFVMSSNGTVIRTSTMSGDMSKIGASATAVISNAVQSFTSDGFVIGNSSYTNTAGVTYHWVALGAGDNLDVGLYTGNGTSQSISNFGFQAETAFVFGESGSQVVYRTNQTSSTFDLSNNGAYTSSIDSLDANGMSLGNSTATNQSSIGYHYFAFNQSSDYFATGTYTGNGLDNRNITGVGFESEFVVVKATSTNNFAIGKTESSGYNVDATVSGSTNQLQALQTDGFQLGSSSFVNASGVTYQYIAFRQNDMPLFVTTTADTTGGTTTSTLALRGNQGGDNAISLREAILATNATRNVNGIADEILFAIPGSGVQTITIGTTGLASITDAVTIDAWTQSGWNSSPLIELNGGNTGTLKDGFNLASGSSGSTIRGFIINRFTGDGIEINSSNNHVIEGNWIGLSNTGTSASANALRGLYAINATGLTIGGTSTASRNVISGNTQQGINFDNVDSSYVYGNYVGTNAAGTGDLNGSTGNSAQSGLSLSNGSSGNQIGNASLSGARNVFSGNNHFGVEVIGSTSTNNIFSGNYIGTTASGNSALGNANGGFSFWGAGTGNLLTSNVISGNSSRGVLVGSSTASAQIQGNIIGLGADGSTWLGNASHGILVSGSSTNTLIGTNADGSNDAAEANVISANLNGILVDTAGTTGTMIYGNYIGTNSTGLLARGNSIDGVRIEAGATISYVGGSGTARRNVIAGNGQDGVQIDGESTDGNFIQNNYIGLGSDGLTVLGNGGSGIFISSGADNTIIGGVGLGNVVVGSGAVGIEIDGASSGTVLYGNFVGINAAGTVVAGQQQNGILIENGASSNTIGGTTAGQGNTITDSGLGGSVFTAGLYVASTAGNGNLIVGNSIYANAGLGIDLGATGITANDALDGDTGPNSLQNTPVLTTATTNGSTVTVSGSLNSLASVSGMIIHFYATPSVGNVSARQGRRYLGSTTVSTDASGNATFTNVALSSAVTAGEVITATTTSSSNNTSEFSQGVVATVPSGNSTPTAQQITSSNGGGIELNNDGGNNAFLVSNTGLASALSAFTVEVKFAGTDTGGELPLFSYNTPNGDTLALMIGLSNELQIDATNSGTAISSAVNYRSLLFDGNVHTLSVTWSNATGAWSVYVDGALVDSGTGVSVGATVATGGVFVFGQEQDTEGGGFNQTQYFRGTLYDARLFSAARTASQIQSSYASDIPRTETGLVANWKFDDLSTAGVVTEAVSGNNLTVKNVVGTGWTASTPTQSLQVNENTTTGTTVGTVYGMDIEREARIASLLSADSSLRYNAETGKFYKVVTTSTDWTVARTNAMATTLSGVAGQLVTVRSAAENSFLQALAQAANKEMWLSGNDITNEGTWRWQNAGVDTDQFWQGTSTGYATNSAYTNWAAGEPNDNGGTGDYQVMYTNGQWDDEANNGSAVANGYFIEWNADTVLDATHALTYSLTSQTVSGAFAINSSTGAITVADGNKLNYEANTSHTITVRVTDGSGASFDKSYTINIGNLTEENSAPTDLSTGINLNTDGGNNAYLSTTNGGAIFGGQTSLTLETSFAIGTNNSNTNTLVSYFTNTGSDEVQLRVTPTGTIHFGINGTVVTSSAFSQLVDGKLHHIAVSWDNTNGDVRYFVDGQLVGTTTGLKTSYTLQGSGTLALGQDQDSLDGTYDPTQAFQGTLYGLRIWNSAISDEQIAQNYQQVPGSSETGLLANYRMSGLSGGTTVVDSVGGVNLTVANASGGAFVGSTPTSTLTVVENATVGTRIGQVIATDADFSRNIVLDGLFREAANPGTMAFYSAGQTIGNWTVQSSSVELAGTTFQSSPLGGRSIELNGSSAGAISQVLSTTVGRQYQVLFNVSGNWLAGDVTKDFRVSAGGTSSDYSLGQPTGWSQTNVLFSGRSMTFTATEANTTLAFQSLDSGDSGALIADVRVIEIPAAVQTLLNNDSTLSYDAATGKFYKTVASNQTFTNAQNAAVASTLNGVSGQLVTIGSQYENDVVWNLARHMNANLWLGAADAAVEGTWRWFNGTAAGNTFWVGTGAGTLQANQYANWTSGEPNDFGGNEDYATFDVSTGKWNDASGTNVPRQYIVEWDASEVLSNYTFTLTSNPGGTFAINSSTGEITVANSALLDYETLTSQNITVQVTDASGNTYSEVLTISLTPVNDNAPVITSNGAGATAAINIAENATSVTTVTATDADQPAPTLSYSIVGGADQSLFTINSSTGQLSFTSARNFEAPADSGANNVYDVIVRASDGTNFDDQSIAVTITNVNEAPTNLYVVNNVSDANVLGYYSFSSANNLGRDDAGDNQPMTMFGSPGTIASPSSGNALDLSGGQYGNIASMTTGGAMTIASWVKFDTTGTWERVIDLGQANSGGIGNIYIGRLANSNDLTFTIEKNGVYTHRATATGGITNGTWMHVAGTVDASGNMTLYINGVAVATATGVAPDVGVRTNHFVGKSNWPDSPFDGAIDDLLITSGAMSASSIASLYQQANTFTLAENAANGTLLGTFYTSDPDAANTYTYSLVEDGGAFAINSSTGQITVNNSSQLNFEGRSSLSLLVRATDQGGLSTTETITVNLTAVNEAPTFSVGTGRNHNVISSMQFGNAVAQQTDGKYVMAGWSDSGGTRDFAVVRYNFDGTLDTTFGSGNGYVITAVGTGGDEAQDIRVLANGKILVQGYAQNGVGNDIAFVQYNSDGSLDTSFGGGTGKALSGISGDDTGYSMAIQSDGKILVGGSNGSDFLVARFNSDGTLDTSFGSSGRVTTDFSSSSDVGRSIAIQSDGKIVLAGQTYNSSTFTDFGVVRYNSDGSLDTSFNSTGKVSVDFGSSTDQGYGLAIQSDGKILVNGFTNSAGTTDNGLVRLTTSGALDTTFNTTGRVITAIGSGSDFAMDLEVQADGKILSSGYANVSGNDFTVVRYNSDGSLDTSFGGTGKVVTNFNATTDDRGAKMFLQADGSVVLAGCTTQSGTYDFAIARYNVDGTADVTFNASNTVGGTVSYTENGSAIVMDSNVSIFDAELTTTNFSGATLTLVRSGGANSQDVYSASGTLSTLTPGGNLVVGGTTIGTVTTNSSGTLVLTFNSNATRTLVETAMRQIAYSNNSDAPPSSVQINWTFNDGNTGAQGTGGALSTTGSVTINITSVNDAPVLDNSGNMTLTTITEDQTSNSGNTVAAIVASASGDRITDVDSGAVEGIAIVATTNGNGTWEYSINGGSSWNAVGSVASNSALLLRSTDLLRFVPNGQNATTGDVTFRAWDQTTGSAGSKVDVSTNGGTTAFSSATEIASIVVTAVNDAPVATADTATAVEAGGTSNGTAGTNPTGNVLTNDTDIDTGDIKTVTGVLAGTQSSATGNVASSVTGTYGSITIAANGAYTYTVDNNNATVQALRTSGQTITDVFTYTMTDAAGSTSTTQITVTIQGANDAPSAVADTATAVESGGVSNGTAGTNPTGNVLTNDTDPDSAGNGETKTVTGVLASTQSSATGNVASSVTGTYGSITIAANGAYTYTVDNNNATVQALRTSGQTITDVFTYTMTDTAGSTSTTQIIVTIQGANDAPLGTDTSLAINEDTPVSLAAADFGFTDIDTGDSLAAVRIDTLPINGTLTLTGSGPVTAGQVITLADINAGKLVFSPANNANGASYDTIAFSVSDLAGAFDGSPNTISIDVTAVNDAPVVDSSGNMTFTSISEDQTNNSGNTVAWIIASAGGDRITDVDTGAVEGIAITALGSGNGTWQYSIDGATWNDVGAVSNTSALLLRSIDLLRFVPDAQNATTADITFRAWDQTGATSGAQGTKVDVSTNGGTTSFSAETEVASITVTAVNDAPTITDGTIVSLTATNEDAASASTSVTSLLTSTSWNDVDTGALLGIAITSTTGNGTWQFSTNGGSTWTGFGAVSGTNSLLLADNAIVRYLPDGQNGETAEFTFRAWDRTTGSASTGGTPVYADSSSNGGTTTFSSQSSTGRIVVASLNDVATANGDTASAAEAGGYSNASSGTNPTGNVLANDTDVDTGDTMAVVGVVAGVQSSATGNVSTSVAGTYGSIQIASDGSYTYTVDNNNAIVQALRTSGQSITDTFTYTLEDSSGAPASAQIVITITGANDAPVATVDAVVAIEAGGLANGTPGTNPTGNLLSNDTDVDSGDTKTVTGVASGNQSSASGSVGASVTGTYGAIAISSNGSYNYVVDNSNATVQALRTASDTLVDVFTYTMTDAAGLTSTTQVTVTIQGANDTPTAANDSAIAVEAGGISNGTAGTNPTGNVLTNDSDIDAGDSKSISGVTAGAAANASGMVGVSVTGQYGSLTLNSDGSYSYTVDNASAAVQALRTSGQTLSEVFTYTMQDAGGLSSTATLTLTIQGSNDAPVAVNNTATAQEAGGISNGSAGTDPTGNVLTNDLDVDAGDTKTVIGVAFGSVASASGSVGATVNGSYGSFVLAANGTYTYTVDNSNATVEALNNGQSLTETFTYTMVDAAGATSTATIVITIDGADDLPFANVDLATCQEAGGLNNGTAGTSPTGNVFSNDVTPNSNWLIGVAAGTHVSASGNVNSAVSGAYGWLVIDANGAYTYTLDNSSALVEALRTSGNHLTDVFTYTFEDSLGYTASTQITITIDGNNDDPISSNDQAIAIEAGGVSNATTGSDATGDVLANDTDVDAGDTKHVTGVVSGTAASAAGSVGSSVTGTYGSVVINADGTFSYTVNNSLSLVQTLRTSGDTLTEVFTYTMEDTAGAFSTATLTITIQGQNDNPVAVADTLTAIEAGGVANGTAGSNPSSNVLANDTDVDAGDTKIVTGVAAGVQSSTTGSVAAAVAGSYGSIQINADGSYTYNVDNTNAAVQALRTSGQSLQDVFSYTVTDAAGATSTTQVTVTIQGANDAPIVTSESITATEAGGIANATPGSNPSGNVLSNETDLDSGDTLTVSGIAAGVQSSASGNVGAAVAGLYGSIQINSNGSYTYTVDNSSTAVQALRLISDTITDVFTYTVQDIAGATSTTQITVTIQGQNDAPVGSADNNDAYESGGTANGSPGSQAIGNVISNDIEYDSGDTTTVIGVQSGIQASTSGSVGSSVAGSYGSIVLGANGAYTYTIDENNAAVQALRLSTQTLNDIFSYTIVDTAGLASTTQVTITLHGTNDAPVGVGDAGIAVEAGGINNATSGSNAIGNVLTNDTDVDSGDTKTVAGVMAGSSGSPSTNVGASVTGSYGSISISSTGAYTYTVDNNNAAVQALRTATQTLQDVFTYKVIDNAGLESTAQVTITIQGANDTPYDLSATPLTIAENLANGSTVGTITTSDLDATDNFTYQLLDDASGRFAIDTNTGVITVANSSLLDHEAATGHSITVQVTDTAGGVFSKSFTVTLTDVNEFAVGAVSDTNAAANFVNENASVGTVVGLTAFATDADSTTNTVTYSLVNNDGGRFAIDANNGVVTVAGAIDRESDGATRNVTVRATSVDGSYSDQLFTIAIGDVDESDTGAVTDTDSSANLVLENAAIGTTVGVTGRATDADATATVTYSLDDDAGGRFAIDSVTGIVTVAGAIDRESSASYNIIIRATSTDSSSSTQSFTIAIGDVDEFDTGAVTDNNGTVNSVVENAAFGTQVGITAQATDGDATTNAISYSLVSDDNGRFAIDPSTGVVTVAGGIDRESDGPTRSITVRATSTDGSFTDQVFTISITDADEYNVGTVSDLDGTANSVVENAAVGTVVGITANAADADATTSGITYTLDDDAGGRFAVDAVTGVVTVADSSLLNYESATSHTITIRATSADGSSATAAFTILLTDVNESAISAISDADPTNNVVLENIANGSTVGLTALATDADGAATVTYSLDDDAGGKFSIDANTGVVKVAGAIDREATNQLQITVRATSSDSSTSTRTFTIAISDVNEFDATSPTDADGTVNSIAENSASGTVVGVTALSFDADATHNSISYALQDDAGGRFAIHAQTGVVSVAAGKLLNFELASSHSITIRATSNDGSMAYQSIVIAVTDVNEAPTASSFSFTTNNVQTLSVGSSVLASGMSDPDGNALTAQVVTGPSHGVLVLASDGSFQYSASAGFVGEDKFTYRASDGQLHSAPVTVTIVVGLPPVNQGGGSTVVGTSSGSTTNNSSTENASTTNSSSSNQPAETAAPAAPTIGGEIGQDNSRIAERSMEAQQSAATSQSDTVGTTALTENASNSTANTRVAVAQLGNLNWDPLAVSGISVRETDVQEGTRLAARRISDMPMLEERELSQLEDAQGDNYFSFVEPAKWTVISTGVVIWAVRLGHIITTFASTASAYVYFDPLTVIQSVKDKLNSDDNITEAMFDTSRGKSRK